MTITVTTPSNTVESPRLIMRPITVAEWALFKRLHRDPAIIALCFDPPDEVTLAAKFAQRLTPWHPGQNAWLCLTIIERATNQWVGVTGFRDREGVAEVGYLLLTEQQGKGYGTESLHAVIEWGRNQHAIHRYRAVVTQGNTGSERVLEKCGFRLTHIEPQAYHIAGQCYDDHIYTLSI